jgi:hypothetical protein
MGAKDTMQNFFMGMDGQMTSGYGAKTISTPMGPFKWDDNINMWVNTNNGMVMSNISFQDQFAMIDYGTSDGSGFQGDPVTLSISPTSWGNFNAGSAASDIWASASGPTTLGSATAVTFTINSIGGVSNTISVALSINVIGAIGGLPGLRYAKNAGGKTTYTTPITMTSGDTLKVGITPLSLSECSAATITVSKASTGAVIGTISGYYN